MPIKHSALTANHRPYAAVYADAAARTAATGFVRGEGGAVVAFDATDLYKFALQLSDNSVWMLTAITPTWAQLSASGASSDAFTDTGTILTVNRDELKAAQISAGVSAFRTAWITAAEVAGEPVPSYLSEGGIIVLTGPNGSYFRLGRYPYGWGMRFDAGTDPLALIAEMYVPKWFSIAPGTAGVDPRLAVRDRNDSASFQMKLNRPATSGGGYGEIGIDNEEGSATILYGMGLKFYVNRSDGVMLWPVQFEPDGKVRIGGTTAKTPMAALDVTGEDGNAVAAIFNSFNSAAGNPSAAIKFRNGAGDTDILTIGSNSGTGESWLNSYDAIHFGVGSTTFADTASERIKIPITGGVQIVNHGTRPAAAVGARGTIFVSKNAAGVQDTIEVCRKTAADAYEWKELGGDAGVGSGSLQTATKTATYTVVGTDDVLIANSASALTFDLPAASTRTRPYYLKNKNTGLLTIDGNAAETIDGSTTFELAQWESVVLISDGANWFVF